LQELHREHPLPEQQREQCRGRGVIVPEVVPRLDCAQEQPEAGAVVGRIEPLAAVSKVAVLEQGSILGVRVSIGARVEQGFDQWTGSGAAEARFSPQSCRASFE
jgi:hypothetical protein